MSVKAFQLSSDGKEAHANKKSNYAQIVFSLELNQVQHAKGPIASGKKTGATCPYLFRSATSFFNEYTAVLVSRGRLQQTSWKRSSMTGTTRTVQQCSRPLYPCEKRSKYKLSVLTDRLFTPFKAAFILHSV